MIFYMFKPLKKRSQDSSRTPLAYDGVQPTSQHLFDLLPALMSKLSSLYTVQPRLLLELWPEVIGDKFAPLTRADRFEGGTLYIKVSNSTLLSLLNHSTEKKRLIALLKKKAPGVPLNTLSFRIG